MRWVEPAKRCARDLEPEDIVVDGLASPRGVQPPGRLARVIRQDNAAAVAPGEPGSGSGDVDSGTQRN
jgi:hypothetical protein